MSLSMYAEKIVAFGEKFRDRIQGEILTAALDYTKYNEETLAMEVLCDHIVEYNCPISEMEYQEFLQILSLMELDATAAPFKYIRSQISPLM